MAIILLFIPAWIAVKSSILIADHFYDPIFNGLASMIQVINVLPEPINYILGMEYGVISMFPFLVLYALPTVLFFSIIWSVYRASSFVDILTRTIHPLIRPFGLTANDIVRVIMGFGCNVPAVISSRCSLACTRENCIAAISFGAACSYQLPATMAVFAVVNMDYLIIYYLLCLVIMTLIYLWFITPKQIQEVNRNRRLPEENNMKIPSLRVIVSDATALVKEFLMVAFPIFILICVMAGLFDWIGGIDKLASFLSPIMVVFNLPGDSITSIVLGSIRKDGIAIGLLDPSLNGLKVILSTPFQVLTVVYLAGVLLPCMVTLLTLIREMNISFALRLICRQMIAAIIFSLIIAWVGYFIYI